MYIHSQKYHGPAQLQKECTVKCSYFHWKLVGCKFGLFTMWSFCQIQCHHSFFQSNIIHKIHILFAVALIVENLTKDICKLYMLDQPSHKHIFCHCMSSSLLKVYMIRFLVKCSSRLYKCLFMPLDRCSHNTANIFLT